MYIGVCHTPVPPPDKAITFAEVRSHEPIDPNLPFDQAFHHFLYDRYYAPWTVYTEGAQPLAPVLESLGQNKQFVCLTINSRTGKIGSFKIASPGHYVIAARCAVKAFEMFKLNGFIALFSEPGLRFGLNKDNIRSWLDPVYETIKMLNPKIPVGAPGEEYHHPNAEGIYETVVKSQKIDILTVHCLTDSITRIRDYKRMWKGPIALVETGSMRKEHDYRTNAGANRIEEIVKYVHGHRDRVICCGFVYGDGSNADKASWTLRLWDKKYTRILNTTPAWNRLVQMVEKYSDQLPEVINVPDWVPQDGRRINFDPKLPVLTGVGKVIGKHDPHRAVTLTDLDWMLEKTLRDDYGIQLGVHYPRDDGSTDEQVRAKLENLAKNLRNLAKW